MINKTRAYVNRRPETFSTMAFTITGFCARVSSVRFVCQITKATTSMGKFCAELSTQTHMHKSCTQHVKEHMHLQGLENQLLLSIRTIR